MRRLRCALVLLFTLPLSSCGGGDGGPRPTLTLPLSAVLQGSVRSDGMLEPTNRVGDLMSGQLVVMLIRFEIGGLPAGAIIEEATLTLPQTAHEGTPYMDLSPAVQVDRVQIGDAIDGTDFNSTALRPVIASLTPATPDLEDKTGNVATAIQEDVNNGSQVADLRVYFPSAGDGLFDDDYVDFGTGNSAGLVVRYRLP